MWTRSLCSDLQKLWCTVDRSLMFYESDLSADPCMQISLKDIVCLGVSRPDPTSNNGVLDRCVCVCVYSVLPELVCLRVVYSTSPGSTTPLSCT